MWLLHAVSNGVEIFDRHVMLYACIVQQQEMHRKIRNFIDYKKRFNNISAGSS